MAIYYMAPTPLGNDTNDGLSPSTPFLTLTHFNTIAVDNDEINLLAGTYDDTQVAVQMSQSGIKILGPNKDINPVTNSGDRVAEAIVTSSVSLGTPLIWLHSNTECQVRGLKFLNVNNRPIYVRNSTKFLAANNVIDGVLYSIGSGYYRAGIDCQVECDTLLIINNSIRNTYYGITVGYNTDGILIYGNEIFDLPGSSSYHAGIHVTEQNSITSNINIYNNIIHDIGGEAVGIGVGLGYYTYTGNFDGCRIHDNTIYNVGRGLLALYKINNIEFDKNNVNSRVGDIYCEWGATNTYIHDNTFIGGQAGVYAWSDPGYPTLQTSGMRIENNKFFIDVSKFDYNAYIIGFNNVSGTITMKDNEFTITGGLVGSDHYGVWGSTYVGGAVYTMGLMGPVDKLEVTGNNINLDGVITAPTMLEGGVTKYVNVDYAPSGGFVMFTKDNYYGSIGSTADIDIHSNTLSNSSDGFGIVAWDRITQQIGGLEVIVDATNNNLAGNSFGVANGVGEYIDARNCWWGEINGPSGGSTDPVTDVIANGDGVPVTENVRFNPHTQVISGIYKPFIDPMYRSDSKGAEYSNLYPQATPGSNNGQDDIELSQYEGNIIVYRDGGSHGIPTGSVASTNGPSGGMSPKNNTGVIKNWKDNPGIDYTPGKA